MATGHPRIDQQESLLADLLQEAVDYMSDEFENAEDVGGAALVEWFGEWRLRAALALDGRRAAPRSS
jgi:hypothetical protein